MPENFLYNKPLISVLLPVYNGAAYLQEAIQSILNQTLTDFELIIINDGSKDNSGLIIEKFQDSRIRYYSQSNIGLSATLNRAIDLANGMYLARQDQDDFSLPERFEKQVEFLENHKKCAMVGCRAQIWVEGKVSRHKFRHPSDNLSLKFKLLFNNPFVHSSMMIRKDIFSKIGMYSTDRDRQPPEDYELWSRVARKFEIGNIPEILHYYRETKSSMSRTGVNPFLGKVAIISAENLAFVLGRSAPDGELKDLSALYNGAYDKISAPPNLVYMAFLICKASCRLANENSVRSAVLFKPVVGALAKLCGRYLFYISYKIAELSKIARSSDGV